MPGLQPDMISYKSSAFAFAQVDPEVKFRNGGLRFQKRLLFTPGKKGVFFFLGGGFIELSLSIPTKKAKSQFPS